MESLTNAENVTSLLDDDIPKIRKI